MFFVEGSFFSMVQWNQNVCVLSYSFQFEYFVFVVISFIILGGGRKTFAVEFTFGMGFLCREYQDCRQLFDMFRSYPHRFDFANRSNVSLITLLVLDSMVRHAVLNEKFLRQPKRKNLPNLD